MSLFLDSRRKEDAAPYLLSPSLERQMNSGKKKQEEID